MINSKSKVIQKSQKLEPILQNCYTQTRLKEAGVLKDKEEWALKEFEEIRRKRLELDARYENLMDDDERENMFKCLDF